MRIKSAYKYQLLELRKPILIYYIVIVVLLILTAISQTLLKNNGNISFSGGFDGATVIFLFVCGLNVFKQTFHMFLANGLSRRTMFVSTAAAFGTVSIGMAFVDGIFNTVMSSLLNYNSIFIGSFGERYGFNFFERPEGLTNSAGVTFPLIADGFVWAVFCYMAAAMIGLFITTAYYRMNKPLKLLISIGVPVLLFIVLPIMDASLFGGAITLAVGRFFAAMTSLLGVGNPYSHVLSNAISILISGGLAWLLMRRATVKS